MVCSAWRILRVDLIAVYNIHEGGNRGRKRCWSSLSVGPAIGCEEKE